MSIQITPDKFPKILNEHVAVMPVRIIGEKPFTGQDITGKRFGRLTVVGLYGFKRSKSRPNQREVVWNCQCDCRKNINVGQSSLCYGNTKSCGCLHLERAYAFRRTHGQCVNRKPSKIIMVWNSMKQRCLNPKNKHYYCYGGAGIHICARWMKFENFLADMGEPPLGMSLDRIDNCGHYEPENCRWATSVQQANNKRTNRILEHAGRRMTLAQWARELKLGASVISGRIMLGWPIAEALSPEKHSCKSNLRQYTVNGRTLNLNQWAKVSNINRSVLADRIGRQCLDLERAIAIPTHLYHQKKL